MSSSATDVETPAKGKWFVSTITTSTSDASPVKVGDPDSQPPCQIAGPGVTPQDMPQGRAERTQAAEIPIRAQRNFPCACYENSPIGSVE